MGLTKAAAAYILLLALVLLPQPSLAEDVCGPRLVENRAYTICMVDTRTHKIQLFWKGSNGTPVGSFERLRQLSEGRNLTFAMNAGMYHSDMAPVGLYVENGAQQKPLNLSGGDGNFYLKPNGVFYVSGTTAGVMETSRFDKLNLKAEFATQSGPMLVIDGQVHPKFSASGTSRKVRNGVGVRDKSTVIFAISEEPVTFSEFAALFKQLGCANALFLDGSISSLYAPSLNRMDQHYPLGPIIGATPLR